VPKTNIRPERVEPTDDGRRLRIVWRDGHVSEYPPRAIRLACPCAGCIDEMTHEPILDPATVPLDINPVAIEYVGRYALKFVWPDGHDTGIYPWDHLRHLCPCEACAADRSVAEREAAEPNGARDRPAEGGREPRAGGEGADA
jgi:DUF971 family protein